MTLSPHQLQLLQQRSRLRAELTSAEDEADPLAAYDDFVKWILQNYANHSESGLLELLEEIVRKFKDDVRYRTGDLRYVKLWILFANHVERPARVYAYMSQQGIGKPYSLFFEEYAEALEREGRFAEAETIIMLGIRTQARPLKHLQAFHDKYVARRAAAEPPPIKEYPFRESVCSHIVNIIREQPLRNIAPHYENISSCDTLNVPSAVHHDITMTAIHSIPQAGTARRHPYAHLHAPLDPGKKLEKFQFDLTLLLDTDGTEYNFVEARARHLGLLGKKWPSPPALNAADTQPKSGSNSDTSVRERSVKVDFNDQVSKAARARRRQSATVTINTKQALEDVFDMYNSPVKENQDVEKPEDEHGARTAEFPKPQNPPVSTRPAFRDENSSTGTKPRAFQPYVDQRRENATPGALKFMPVTTKTPTVNAFTPSTTRKALVSKEIMTPVPAFKVVRPEQNATTSIMPSEVRSPTEQSDDLDVFGGGDITATDEFTEEFTNPQPVQSAPRSFVPFVDENILLPTARRSDSMPASATSKIPKFQVHRDENTPPVRPLQQPAHTSTNASLPLAKQETSVKPDDEDTSECFLSDEYEEPSRFAQSGRFASFDVMTPITERTFEFTTSTRVADTPGSEHSSKYDKGFVAFDAQDAAEQLAAELQEEEDKSLVAAHSPVLGPGLLSVDKSASSSDFSYFDRPRTAAFRVSDGFTIEPNHSNLSSSAIVVNGTTPTDLTAVNIAFDPPNPCVPSDPAVLSVLMTAFLPDQDHRELGKATANQLEELHRFAEKRARRGSGASSSGRTSDSTDGLVLELGRDQFEFLDKLGEGGFGAVFMARTMTRASGQQDEKDEDEDHDEDNGFVAVKVVRPTNRWESFVLRRVITAIPDDLRRSIIRPHTLYAYKDESYLVLDLCQQGTLLEIVNRATETGVAQPGGGVDELLVMFFTAELLRIVQGLHDHGFIHGDLKIDNCLIRLEDVPGGASAWSSEYSPSGAGGWAHKGLTLVDFGRTIDTSLFPPGQTFLADWATDGRDCVEMREGLAWTYQADYAGLASIVHCMLFGRYIETTAGTTGAGTPRRWRPVQAMKRYWQAEMWTRLFDVLLNPCLVRKDGSLPVTRELGALRGELEAWIQANCNKGGKNLKGMLKKIEIATLRRAPRK